MPVSITHMSVPVPSSMLADAACALLRPVAAALPFVAEAVLARCGCAASSTEAVEMFPGRIG